MKAAARGVGCGLALTGSLPLGRWALGMTPVSRYLDVLTCTRAFDMTAQMSYLNPLWWNPGRLCNELVVVSLWANLASSSLLFYLPMLRFCWEWKLWAAVSVKSSRLPLSQIQWDAPTCIEPSIFTLYSPNRFELGPCLPSVLLDKPMKGPVHCGYALVLHVMSNTA